MWVLILILIASVIMTIRAFLIAIGAYKDPVLASFEHYGEEKVFSPVYSLLAWVVVTLYSSLFFLISPGVAIILGIFLVFPMMSLRSYLDEWVTRYANIVRRFPQWYYDLSDRTDREERRRIAYLWLKLPPRTRMLYNTQTPFFRNWVDQVLMTID